MPRCVLPGPRRTPTLTLVVRSHIPGLSLRIGPSSTTRPLTCNLLPIELISPAKQHQSFAHRPESVFSNAPPSAYMPPTAAVTLEEFIGKGALLAHLPDFIAERIDGSSVAFLEPDDLEIMNCRPVRPSAQARERASRSPARGRR